MYTVFIIHQYSLNRAIKEWFWGAVVAERSKRQSIDRELPYWRFRLSSNPAAAVAPFGKVLYPHCQVFRRRLWAVSPVYIWESHPIDARKRTHFTSRKRAGRNPGEVVSQSNIRKRVYDVDPSWFTLEGYITLCIAYERRQRKKKKEWLFSMRYLIRIALGSIWFWNLMYSYVLYTVGRWYFANKPNN